MNAQLRRAGFDEAMLAALAAEDVLAAGRPTSSRSCATPVRLSKTPAPAAVPPWTDRVLDDLLERYDTAVASGIIHNQLRDWETGNHPGYTLGCWLRDYKDQVFLFTRNFAVQWTNNVSESGAKAAKRHQAVSGYWHSSATLARWCRLRSYLDSTAAHGTTALDAITTAIAGKPWLPPLPAIT